MTWGPKILEFPGCGLLWKIKAFGKDQEHIWGRTRKVISASLKASGHSFFPLSDLVVCQAVPPGHADGCVERASFTC